MSEQAPSNEKVHGSVLSEAIDCCRSWEPEARLIGNVRAIDLRDLLLELWTYRNTPEPPAAPHYLDGLTIEQWREHAKAGWAMYAARTSEPPCARRRPTKAELYSWNSAEDERDWWRAYALEIEGAAQPPLPVLGQWASWLERELGFQVGLEVIRIRKEHVRNLIATLRTALTPPPQTKEVKP